LRKTLALILAFMIVSATAAPAQTRRRSTPRRSTAAKRAAEKTAAEIQAARASVVAQIKTLSHFLYLYGGIAKGIESADLAARNREASTAAINQNEQNKTRVKESLRNVVAGLDKLETEVRTNPALRSYQQYVAGVGRIGETAETQALANRFDEAGRSLLKAVNQLTDALAAMR
jgi:hypothetical protein